MKAWTRKWTCVNHNGVVFSFLLYAYFESEVEALHELARPPFEQQQWACDVTAIKFQIQIMGSLWRSVKSACNTMDHSYGMDEVMTHLLLFIYARLLKAEALAVSLHISADVMSASGFHKSAPFKNAL